MKNKFGVWEYYIEFNIVYRWKRLFERNIFTKWIYMVLPFGITTLVFVLMELDGALIMSGNNFSFARDISNSFCMVLLLMVSYFLGGVYPTWINECVSVLKHYISNKGLSVMLQNVAKITHGGMIISCILALLGCPFAIVAHKQNVGWMSIISDVTYIVYYIYLTLVWYFSFCLLFYALTGIYIIRTLLRDKSFNLFKRTYDEILIDIPKITKVISTTISYSLFYVCGAIIMIVMDNINYSKNSDINMTFHAYPIVAILTVFVMLSGLAYALMPALEYYKVVGAAKEVKLKEISKIKDETLREKEYLKLEKIKVSIFESGFSKLALILSVVSPLLSLVAQLAVG